MDKRDGVSFKVKWLTSREYFIGYDISPFQLISSYTGELYRSVGEVSTEEAYPDVIRPHEEERSPTNRSRNAAVFDLLMTPPFWPCVLDYTRCILAWDWKGKKSRSIFLTDLSAVHGAQVAYVCLSKQEPRSGFVEESLKITK